MVPGSLGLVGYLIRGLSNLLGVPGCLSLSPCYLEMVPGYPGVVPGYLGGDWGPLVPAWVRFLLQVQFLGA